MTTLLAAKPKPLLVAARPGFVESAILFAALLATALIPVLGKYQAPDEPMGNSPVAQVVWGLLYVAATIRVIDMRRAVRPLVMGSIALCLFVLLMLASFVWSVAPSTTFVNAIELIGTTVIAYYIVARYTLSDFLWILALSFGSIAILCFALIFLAPGHGRMFYGSGPWCGIYQDKNNLGAAMSLAVLSIAMLLMRRGTKRKPLLFVLLAMCATLLAGSESATALADCLGAGAICCAVLACLSPKFGTFARIVTASAIVATLLTVGFVGLNPDALLGMIGRTSTLTGRTDFWPILQHAIADRPLLGYGYNAFFRSFVGDNYLSYYVVEAGGWTPYHAHNSFLQICLDAGYAGAALLIYLLVTGLWKSVTFVARNANAMSAWPLATILYLVLGSFTETYLGNYNTSEWIFFVAALLYPLKERVRQEL